MIEKCVNKIPTSSYGDVSLSEIKSFLKDKFPRGFLSKEATTILNDYFNKTLTSDREKIKGLLLKKMVKLGLLERRYLRTRPNKPQWYYFVT